MCFTLRKLLWLTAVVALNQAVLRSAEPLNDAEIERLIVGDWYEAAIYATGVVSKSTTTFRQDGTFVGETVRKPADSTRGKTTMTGTWKVKASQVIQMIETIDDPVWAKQKLPHKQAFTVIAINSKQRQYKWDKIATGGQKTRVLPPAPP